MAKSAEPAGRRYSLADADAEAEVEAETDGRADPDGAGTEGTGMDVGAGMNRDGIPRNESTKMSTKIPTTTMIHGRASRSLRGGSAPR
jgi:hypothetical protein